VVGVILNLAIWFGLHTLFRETVHVGGLALELPVLASVDAWAVLLAAAAALAIFRFKIGMLATLAGCSLAGVAIHLLGGTVR